MRMTYRNPVVEPAGGRAGSLIALVVVGLGLLAPPVARADGPAAPAAPLTVLKDLPYKSGDPLTDYERDRCKLDLYLPAGKGFATVVWFYGGGMEAGEKGGRVNVRIATKLAQRGVACAVANYRLSPKAKYPAYLDDAAAGVAWALAHVA